ncbi:fatty acid desaturase [Myxococcota bacterium]|nr:fatty acid desaturase [Myxococcota bacterium]
MVHGDYLRVLKPLLPAEAFRPSPVRLLALVAYAATVVGGMAVSIASGDRVVQLVLALFIGHQMAGVVFFAHDLSHGSILRWSRTRYVIEAVFWGLVYMPATMWRKIHVDLHHGHTQTLNDCDRQPFESEKSLATKIFEVTYPHRDTPWWNPIVWTQIALYTLGNTAVSLRFGIDPKRPVSPYVYTYDRGEFARLVAETLFIVAVRVAIWVWADLSFVTFLLVDFVPFLVGTAVMMAYIATNHGTNPIDDHVDPVRGSTSVQVPAIADALHSNFAFHTEHHLFPAMSPKWYPEVGRLLATHFPDRYRTLPMLDAWRELYQRPAYHPDPATPTTLGASFEPAADGEAR